jgi:hypothetical protein
MYTTVKDKQFICRNFWAHAAMKKTSKEISKEVLIESNMSIRCRKCFWFMENIIPEAVLLGNWFYTYGVRISETLKGIYLTDNLHELHATYLHCQQLGV